MSRTWVSPAGKLFDVNDEDLYQFCKQRGLHYQNMRDHIVQETSDQKNGGWQLIERLRAIGHVSRPHEHVLAIGTVEAFHSDCLSSTDGRAVLKNRDSLVRLLGNRYKGGKPWSQWEHRQLSTAQKRELLQRVTPSDGSAAEAAATAQASVSSTMQLPDFATAVSAFEPAAVDQDDASATPPERLVARH